MRTLYLLRHAKSSWDDPALADFDRPLNSRGRKAARQLAAWLAGRGYRPALVICSPARRTRETYAALADVLNEAEICFEKGLYAADSEILMNRLKILPQSATSAMIIGHNPGLERLALSLVGSREGQHYEAMRRKFPTAALAVLDCPDWNSLAPDSCLLREFLVPRETRAD